MVQFKHREMERHSWALQESAPEITQPVVAPCSNQPTLVGAPYGPQGSLVPHRQEVNGGIPNRQGAVRPGRGRDDGHCGITANTKDAPWEVSKVKPQKQGRIPKAGIPPAPHHSSALMRGGLMPPTCRSFPASRPPPQPSPFEPAGCHSCHCQRLLQRASQTMPSGTKEGKKIKNKKALLHHMIHTWASATNNPGR